MASRRQPPAGRSTEQALAQLLERALAEVPHDALSLPDPAWAARLQQGLAARLQRQRQRQAGCTTVRGATPLPLAGVDGVQQQALYHHQGAAPPRPGEPLRTTLFHLAAGAALPAAGWLASASPDGLQREWLLLRGQARWQGGPGPRGTFSLRPLDYLALPAGAGPGDWHSRTGATLFLREAPAPEPASSAPSARSQPFLVRDAASAWQDFGPGIQRHVLWAQGSQAAMLYRAQAGASVPAHRHGHDEECLVLQGELFLDDLLLQPGHYQLAPAGSGHHSTDTDVGALIYAHGDIDLQFSA